MEAPKHYTYQRREPKDGLLHQIIQKYYPTLKSQGSTYPNFVYKTFEDYLKCGAIQQGFLRIKCSTFKYESIIGLSCKRRGFCPSCSQKAMVESSSHLVDFVLPDARYRQIVVTLPYDCRYLVATNPKMISTLNRIITGAIERCLETKANAMGIHQLIGHKHNHPQA